MLLVESVDSYYGGSHILRDVSLRLESGEAVAILGRNGAGKTTLLRSIMGLSPPVIGGGSIYFDGEEITGLSPYLLARRGIAYMPESRPVFLDLSVSDNLRLVRGYGSKALESDIYDLFPSLGLRKNHLGAELSGGEQKMLALARCLCMRPRLLILDELGEGLAPLILQKLTSVLREMRQISQVGSADLAILLVDQNFAFATSLADRVYVLGKGQVRFSGSVDEIRNNDEIHSAWLGV